MYIVYKWKKIFIYIKLLHVYFFIELHNYMHTCNSDINIHFEKCYEINFWSWVICFLSNILKILENWFCMLVVFNEVYIIAKNKQCRFKSIISPLLKIQYSDKNHQILSVWWFQFWLQQTPVFRWKRWNRQYTMRRPIRHYHAILYQEVGIKSINFQC